jgi:hypothetical protein
LRAALVDSKNLESRLRSFIEGKIDGKDDQHEVDRFLTGILRDKVVRSKRILATFDDQTIEGRFCRVLWQYESDIARQALYQFSEERKHKEKFEE